MAVILTMSAASAIMENSYPGIGTIFQAIIQLGIGLGMGIAAGYGCAALLRKVRFISGGIYPVFTVALAMLTFAVPSLMWGSGFLAVYVAAVIIGNNDLPHQSSLRRVHDAIAWFSQVGLFLNDGTLS